MKLLEYENQIFLDLCEQNAILILCEGLGLDRIFLTMLRLYCDLKELVFVLNTDDFQQGYYTQQLSKLGVKRPPVAITSDYSATERQKLYAQGGVYFISSRIAVMDFLVNRIPVEHVTGILVSKAHRMVEACQESFILNLFREKNKTGFIRGFTDNPTAFIGEYAKLEKAMKHLFVEKAMLWPRFHASIVSCLKEHGPEVIEVGITMTESMVAIQSCLLEIVTACMQEIKSFNPGLDIDELTLEKSLGRSFDRNIRAQLDPSWNQIGSKTKNLVNDLKMLRRLLRSLTQYDCVTFLKMIENMTASQKAFGKNAGWLFLDAADKLVFHARRRVYGKKAKLNKDNVNPDDLLFEPSPKWTVLTEVLDDIRDANKQTADTKLGEGKVLICASDFCSVSLLHAFISHGSRPTLIQKFNKAFRYSLETGASGGAPFPTTDNEIEEMQSLIKCGADPETYLHALYGNADFYSLAKELDNVEPRFVILCNNSINFVRQLEIYKACRPGMPLRVYVFTYESSTEEQAYLTSIRREKEAFNSLIQERATMVIPKEREGKTEYAPQFERGVVPAYQDPQDTRKGGKQVIDEHNVVVDMREFRSELPALLYRRGIRIEPLTIEVGDYILTPEICVERKSLGDLIESLNSGRLYNQCVAMSRYYKRPMLMIEFDASKAFSFKARGVTANTTLKELNQKLTLLILHFPMLKFAWCPSPAIAAEFFHEIKVGREQPDGTTAAAIGVGSGKGVESTHSKKYNSEQYDFLLKLPGIDATNCRRVLNHVHSLKELIALSEEQLAEILGAKASAQQLYEFFHRNYAPDEVKVHKTVKSDPKSSKGKRPFNPSIKSHYFVEKRSMKSNVKEK